MLTCKIQSQPDFKSCDLLDFGSGSFKTLMNDKSELRESL